MLLLLLTVSAFSGIFFTSKATFSPTTASTEFAQTTSTGKPIHGQIYFSELISNDETPNPPRIRDIRSKRQVDCVCSYYHDGKTLQATINGIKGQEGAILLRVGETAVLSCVNSSMNLVWPNGACASASVTCNVCRRFNENDIPFCLASRMDTDISCIRYPDEDVNMLNVDYEDKDIRVGSKATFSCQNSNQRLNGTSASVCLRSGEWSAPPPRCMDITCTELKETDLMAISYTDKQKIGSFAYFNCFASAIRSGVARTVCLENGEWQDSMPTCKNTDIHCIRYPDEDVNMLNVNFEDKDIRVGSRATFSCRNKNQTLYGTNVSVCLRSGEWSSSPPQCMDITCTELKETDLMAISYTDKQKVGSFAYFHCFASAIRFGAARTVCLENGEWQDFMPTCQIAEEFSSNPVIIASSEAKKNSSKELEDCFCTYYSINWYLFASVDLRKLENGGLVKKGDTVRLDCRYSSMYIVWPNGMINRYYAEMTCDKCQTWGEKELPSCTNIVKGDSFIGLDGTMNVLPGGAIESQRGKKLEIACFSESDYPHWNYSYSKERLEVTYNHTFSRCFSFLNIPGFSGKHAYSFECSTKRSFHFSFKPSNLELRLTEKCSAEPSEIPHGKFHYESRDLNSKVEYNCDPGYQISGQTTVKCHHGEWSGQPPDCVKAEEFSWNPVTDVSPTTEESNLGEPANCYCVYYPYSPFENMLLVASVVEKTLKNGDRVKKGDTVQLACEYSFMHFRWPNGMRTLTASMTCDVCQPWGVKELPSCSFNETGHTYVVLDETMKVQPGGVVECQSGKKLNIACFSEEVQPDWHSSNVKERLDKTRNDTSSRYFSILNIAHFSEKYANSYECIAKRPFLSLSYRPTRLELRLTGTPRCPPPKISPGSKLVIIPQKTFFYIGERISFLCPVGQKLNPEIRRMTCFKRAWSKEVLPECVKIAHNLL